MAIRSADAVTLIRTAMVFLIVYLVFIKFSPAITILLLIIMFVLDAVDGFFGIREASGNKVGLATYVKAALGEERAKKIVSYYKKRERAIAKFGPRIDVAGDRIIEYTLWIAFTYIGIIPLFVLFIVIIRHSFADALMGARGTSSKMKTRFAKLVYSSNIGRGGINVVKIVTFAYLILVYVSSYPISIGYALIAILVTYILVRGAAEIYESIS